MNFTKNIFPPLKFPPRLPNELKIEPQWSKIDRVRKVPYYSKLLGFGAPRTDFDLDGAPGGFQ